MRKSGGVAVFIKNNLFKYFSHVESECEYVLWFKLSKCLFKTDEDVIFGTVYVPPANSGYNVNIILEKFHYEIDDFARSYKNLVLIGDFNARTSVLTDVTETDADIYNHIDIDPDEVFSTDNVHELENLGFNSKRTSEDKICNKYGKILIDSCKYNDLTILNGRAFTDKNIGRTTCKNSSVVDYVISSVSFLNHFTQFSIRDFCDLYSGAHASIEFHITLQLKTNILNKAYTNEGKIRPWDETKQIDFLHIIDPNKVDELNYMLENTSNLNKDNINEIMTNVESIFEHAAESTFGRYGPRKESNSMNIHADKNRKWFNGDC